MALREQNKHDQMTNNFRQNSSGLYREFPIRHAFSAEMPWWRIFLDIRCRFSFTYDRPQIRNNFSNINNRKTSTFSHPGYYAVDFFIGRFCHRMQNAFSLLRGLAIRSDKLLPFFTDFCSLEAENQKKFTSHQKRI